MMMRQGMRNAITKSAVLLLRPFESCKIEQVPRFLSKPKTPTNIGKAFI